MKTTMNIGKYSFLTLLFAGVIAGVSMAQQSPIVSSYFQNEYLFNAAQVGVNETKAVDVMLRTPVGQLKDDMKDNFVHVMYGFGRNGVGAGFRSNRVGAFKMVEANASYAFHIPLDGEQQFLSLGTGFKFLREQIDVDKIVGNDADPTIAYYNNDPNRVDFNLGLAYRSDHVVINAAMNNILRDRQNFLLNTTPYMYGSFKYNLTFEDVSVSPVVAYRRLLNNENVYDFGTSVGVSTLNAYFFYHTSNNFSTGISAKVKSILVNLGYSTTTGRVQGMGMQGLDLGLRYAW